MAARTPLKSFISGFKKQRSVTDAIAAETWTFHDRHGRKHSARIEVGRPRQVPNDEQRSWFCPVFIEGWTQHVIPVMGVGPVDSLMNANTLLRSFLEQLAWSQIAVGGPDRQRQRVPVPHGAGRVHPSRAATSQRRRE
jgi:hypothetical protein